MNLMKSILLAALLAPIALEANEAMGPVKVEIIEVDGGYQLLRGGEPYHVKGAGLNKGDMHAFVAHGGNSIRNWSTDNAQALLDLAHELGVTVALCLGIGSERHGFDYNDDKAIAEQKERARGEVLKYKDHPALLAWIIGNELNLEYSNSKVYDAVNDISKMIHELDPNHPTTTTVAGLNEQALKDLQQRATDLDFFSFQAYGQMALLREFVPPEGFGKPLMITEWGAVGYWEVAQTSWGAPIEMNSSRKASVFRSSKLLIEAVGKQIVGNYAFLWGWKQERTPTWFGLFTEHGELTEAIDEMHVFWNGAFPENRAPWIHDIRLDGRTAPDSVTLTAGETVEAWVSADDFNNDPLTYLWELKPESTETRIGGDYEASIASLHGLIPDHTTPSIKLTAPAEPGAYRLFVYVHDDENKVAHANIPFLVTAE